MLVMPIYEFLLWDNCTNNCKFCFQRKSPRLFSIDFQKQILNNVLSFINSDKFQVGSHILLVGGEIFDDSNRKFIIEFFDKICKMMTRNTIELCYLNTNLLYEDLNLLFLVLDVFKQNNLLDRLKFTTSYDLVGRFSTNSKEQLFISNLRTITSNYNVKVVTNMILSNELCRKIIDQTFSLSRFQQENNTELNLIPYIILDESLATDKNNIMQALTTLKKKDYMIFKNFLFNINIKQPRKMFYFKDCKDIIDNKLTACECKLLECGHSENFKRYTVDKKSCFVCDINEVFNADL